MNFIYYIMKDRVNMTWIQQYWKQITEWHNTYKDEGWRLKNRTTQKNTSRRWTHADEKIWISGVCLDCGREIWVGRRWSPELFFWKNAGELRLNILRRRDKSRSKRPGQISPELGRTGFACVWNSGLEPRVYWWVWTLDWNRESGLWKPGFQNKNSRSLGAAEPVGK
jgi:hypothetical protein